MVDFTALATTAKTLVDANGRDVTFLKFDRAAADANKPWRGPSDARGDADASVDLKAAFVEPSGAVRLGITSEHGALFRRAQQIMIVPAASTAEDLTTFQEVVDGGSNWKITDIETLKPADVTLLYFVGVRR